MTADDQLQLRAAWYRGRERRIRNARRNAWIFGAVAIAVTIALVPWWAR